jgi:hypothetical protein
MYTAIFLSASCIVTAMGILFMMDRKLGWSILELDARLFRGKILKKPKHWQSDIFFQGLSFTLLGVIGLLVGMGIT